MALEILEKDDFKDIKNILLDESIDENCLVKQGFKKAAEALCIDLTCPP